MAEERFVITGALGCIGAWVVRTLVREQIPTVVFDLASDPHRLRLIMSDDELAQVRFISGDITDLSAVERVLADTGATQIIHLAGLQVPFCRTDPSLGARVNVVGTVNVFEAARRAQLPRVVYASSLGVYGISEEYPDGPITHDALPRPRTHYGVYKQANEGNARVYWLDAGISSIGLRPYIVYGPGRDQGVTAEPTKAMLAAATGQPYHVPFGGRFDIQFAEDVARIFIQATRVPFTGADVFNLHGSTVTMPDIIDAITATVPQARDTIQFTDTALPFPDEADDTPLSTLFGTLPHTALTDGVAATIATFRAAVAAGRLASSH